MPLGHSWTPIVRVTPPAGAAYSVTLSNLVFMTVCQPSYEEQAVVKEMLNRSIRKVPYGFRVHVHQEFEFYTPAADETTLAEQVISPASDPDDDVLIEISLDNGAVYREAELVGYSQGPIEKKNIGLLVSLDWTCVQLIENKPAIGSGSW
jgi:hypothetical protein